MNLYRIISEEEWIKTKIDRKVPRCGSDRRAGHIHLNKFEDIETVANKYFEKSESPVVLEVTITTDLKKRLSWELPTKEKPWGQAHLQVENIDINFVKRFSYLIPKNNGKEKFKVGEFLNLD